MISAMWCTRQWTAWDKTGPCEATAGRVESISRFVEDESTVRFIAWMQHIWIHNRYDSETLYRTRRDLYDPLRWKLRGCTGSSLVIIQHIWSIGSYRSDLIGIYIVNDHLFQGFSQPAPLLTNITTHRPPTCRRLQTLRWPQHYSSSIYCEFRCWWCTYFCVCL